MPRIGLSDGLCDCTHGEEHTEAFCCSSSSCRFGRRSLLRVYALEGIIRETGTTELARCSGSASFDRPLQIMHTSVAVYLGIIYSYLPFMVLPLFATLEKLDHSLLEAAADLGSPPWRAFIDVTLPLSMPGVIAGSMLVFIPAIGEFVIPTSAWRPRQLDDRTRIFGTNFSATVTGPWHPPSQSPSSCYWSVRSRSTNTTAPSNWKPRRFRCSDRVSPLLISILCIGIAILYRPDSWC